MDGRVPPLNDVPVPSMPQPIETRSKPLLIRYRGAAFLAANVAFVLLIIWGSSVWNVPLWRPLYLCALFALCSAPILTLTAFNDRYVLLALFMAEYFVVFGLLDFQSVLLGEPLSTDADFTTPAEASILVGAIAVLVAYLAVARSVATARASAAVRDWPRGTVLAVGLGLTAAGSVAYWYFHLIALTVSTNTATTRAFETMGPTLTFIVMLGHLVRPLGILILAYGYARYRTVTWLVWVLAALALQIFLGFVGDSKGLPLQAGAIVVLTRMLVDNRLPRIWIVSSVAVTIVLFPIFQAYRADVIDERGLNRAQALQNLSKVIQIAVGNRDKVSQGSPGERSQSILERASIKGNVELLFTRVGSDIPFEDGQTLADLAYAFVPKLIWADKPPVETGQLFNRLVIRGEGDTDVSPSHLGELYWNFGWPGLTIGMAFIGALLGYVGAKSNLADGLSATRLMVMMATVYSLCMDFEGSIAISYVVWLRSIAAIGVLHLLLARPARGERALTAATRQTPGPPESGSSLPVRFPNVLRY